MARIGLKAIRISEGLTNLFEINGDPSWISKMRDVRSDLKCIENIQLRKHYLMLTNIEDGFLLSIIIPIGGREGDCFNVSLFIPKNTENTTCVEKIIDEVETQFKNGRFNKERLQEVVDTCGIKLSNAERVVNQSKGDVVAYRVIKNKEDRVRLLGALNQKDYSEYKMVMILNEEDIAAQRCVDLTNKVIKEEVVVKAPQKIKGFKPYIDTEKPFDKDLWLEKNCDVEVIWKCDGYNDIKKPLKVGVGEIEPPIVRYLSEYTIICKVTNQWEDGTEVRLSNDNDFKLSNDDYDIWIESVGKNEKSVGSRYITEKNEVIVVVYEDNLEEKEERRVTLDLNTLNTEIKKEFYMKKRKEIEIEDKTFILKSRNDDMSFKEFEVESGKLKVKKEPGNAQKLESKSEPKAKNTAYEWIWRIVSFLVGMLVVFIVLLICSPHPGSQENKKIAPCEIDTTKVTSAVAVYTDSAYIEYLKKNNTWHKDSLEKYPPTKGLFVAMKEYDFKEMKKFWENIYKANNNSSIANNNLKTYKVIVEITKKINLDNNIEDFSPQDNTINLDDYLKDLKQKTTPKNNNALGKEGAETTDVNDGSLEESGEVTKGGMGD